MSRDVLVVKFGGHAMTDNDGVFAQHLVETKKSGKRVVVVHGGGPQINSALEKAGVASDFIGGYRVTTPAVFEIVEDVLSNQVGPTLAQTLTDAGVLALAISGRHSGTLFAQRQYPVIAGELADLGLVGEVVRVDSTAINELLDRGITPVVSPISNQIDSDGGLNVNADIAAAAIAGALQAKELIVMTDVAGIYRNWPDKSSLISSITSAELNSIKSEFQDGMAPKVQACLEAIAAGADAVRIIDGRQAQAFADALAHSGGTLVTS